MILEVATSPSGAGMDAAAWAPRRLRSERPDVDVRALLLRLNLYPARPTAEYSLERGRRDWQLAIKAFASRPEVASVTERRIPNRLRIYTPAGGAAPRPLLVWMHGGGFILGDLYTAGATCRALAARSGAIVVAAEYRLAPEHDLAAGQDDCLAAVEWVAAHAAELGGDPARIAVGGDSAGGGLAAMVAQRCAGRIPLALQVLAYPATDLGGDYEENTSGFLLTGDNIEWIRSHMRAVSDLADPAFSPLRSPAVAGVAPALVITAGFDPIRDDGLAYAARLRAAGVPTRTLHYRDQIHGFLSFDRVLAGGRDALDRIAAALADGLVPEHEPPHVVQRRTWPSDLSRGSLAQRRRELGVLRLMAGDWVSRLVP